MDNDSTAAFNTVGDLSTLNSNNTFQNSAAIVLSTGSLTNIGGPVDLPNGEICADAGTLQSAQTNSAFATELEAVVRNADGSLAVGATVTFTRPSGGASGTFSAATGFTMTANGLDAVDVTTNASGIARVAFTANGTIGSYAVSAQGSIHNPVSAEIKRH